MFRMHIALSSKMAAKKIATSVAATKASTRENPSSGHVDPVIGLFIRHQSSENRAASCCIMLRSHRANLRKSLHRFRKCFREYQFLPCNYLLDTSEDSLMSEDLT